MDLMQGTGRHIGQGERAEAELDSFISRRDTQRRKNEPERELEATWAAAERRQEALRKAEMDRGRLEWHRATWRASIGGAWSTTRPP